jgi:hypothetical protein
VNDRTEENISKRAKDVEGGGGERGEGRRRRRGRKESQIERQMEQWKK